MYFPCNFLVDADYEGNIPNFSEFVSVTESETNISKNLNVDYNPPPFPPFLKPTWVFGAVWQQRVPQMALGGGDVRWVCGVREF